MVTPVIYVLFSGKFGNSCKVSVMELFIWFNLLWAICLCTCGRVARLSTLK
jgi:hypothetical protein